MRKTYAYNSIIIGILIGILIYVSSNNAILAVLACLGISVAGFFIIRALENAVSKGVDKAVDAATRAYENHKQNKNR